MIKDSPIKHEENPKEGLQGVKTLVGLSQISFHAIGGAECPQNIRV